MAKDITRKQLGCVTRIQTAIVALLTHSVNLSALCDEFNDNFYATGADPANPWKNITDDILQNGGFPGLDAPTLNQAIGAIVAVNAAIEGQIGYLEAMRP